LTGDQPASAGRWQRELGVPVQAGLLPEQKLDALHALRQAGTRVAMVGDGINDGPALAASDVGIALGCGADIARDNADVCLLDDDLGKLPWALRLSRATVRIVRQNLFWAFLYNTVGIALACAGVLNPVIAALAMVASSLCVVVNSLRLQRIVYSPGAEARP
jgi:P-type E1-E2 ATPase